MDAIVGMEGWGHPVELNLVIAGTDVVAVDTVAAIIMGIDVICVKHLLLAGDQKLGISDLARIEIRGENIGDVRRSFRRPKVKFFEHIIPASNNRGKRSCFLWPVFLPLIVILVVVFLTTRYIFPQYSKLFLLFLYSIPAQFIVAIIPHEPIIFYFSKYFSPLSVTLGALLGTLFAEYLNYMLVKMFFKIPKLVDLKNHRTFKNATYYFLKLPFVSLVIAAITPVPFYPFRIIVPVSEYSLAKYLLALIVGRTPRFYILAYFGYSIPLPNEIIIVLFILFFAVSVLYWFRRKGLDKNQRYRINDSF